MIRQECIYRWIITKLNGTYVDLFCFGESLLGGIIFSYFGGNILINLRKKGYDFSFISIYFNVSDTVGITHLKLFFISIYMRNVGWYAPVQQKSGIMVAPTLLVAHKMNIR